MKTTMSRFGIASFACGLMAMAGIAQAQALNSGATTLALQVPVEALLTVSPNTSLTTSGTTFQSKFTGTTTFQYWIRTTKSGGAGTITLKVTDFNNFGPTIASLVTNSDVFTYSCTATVTAEACNGAQPVINTTSSTSVASFLPNKHSLKAGDSGSVIWTLDNDPAYEVGNHDSIVTFTISAT